MEYTIIDAEETPDLAREYGIMQAPTLVAVKGDEINKYPNVSRIKQFVDSL